MSRFWTLAVFLTLCGSTQAASPDPKDLAVPPADLSRARDLVRGLASEVYRERESAQVQLSKMGRRAKPVLEEAMCTDPDPEVRLRCGRLLPRAVADDFSARAEAFIADTEGKYEHDMPGWSLFRKYAGSDKAARDFFIEIIKTTQNNDLLAALSGDSPDVGKLVASRRNLMFFSINQGARFRGRGGITSQAFEQLTLGDVATLLIAETVVPNKDIPRPGPFGFINAANFIQQPISMNVINATANAPPHAEVYKRVLAQWLETRTTAEDLNQTLWIANSLRGMKEADNLMRRVVTTDGIMQHQKTQAMMFLAQRNGKSELPLLISQLTNETALQKIQINPNLMIESQIRDVALALCLHLSGQDLKNYGFEFQPGFLPQNVINTPWGFGFATDDKRKAAITKWEKWYAEHKDDKPMPEKK